MPECKPTPRSKPIRMMRCRLCGCVRDELDVTCRGVRAQKLAQDERLPCHELDRQVKEAQSSFMHKATTLSRTPLRVHQALYIDRAACPREEFSRTVATVLCTIGFRFLHAAEFYPRGGPFSNIAILQERIILPAALDSSATLHCLTQSQSVDFSDCTDSNFSLVERGADEEEVTFRDLADGTGKTKAGYRKIHFCRRQAAKDELQYFWGKLS
ncbi:uncharacterized protein BDR25DRAFT_390158 [Lindgomyces ingoldianus]|uniref:Uncharacterized protein n=1 Tax=Lindgomyces ingoldianus TaxID=673940 RepID=A0ACB6RH09_9PLEO|nr:uncharacterized protein BDR25DRAFT_390158 [Lindgomyces ingoldianus]KAF2477620.1 hypothetical protein BDR25DRAFT_390158 [Lindgomyces ingoldianus]